MSLKTRSTKKNGLFRQINLGNVVYYSLLKIDNALWYIEILKIPSVKNMVLLS